MKKLSMLSGFIAAAVCLSAGLLGGCSSSEATDTIKVVTSTSLMEQIVSRLGGERVEVVNIIPPAQCPGHFDVSPGDIMKLSDADLFLLHGWQGEQFSQELIDSADNPDLVSLQINASVGQNQNWMTPAVQIVAAESIADALAQVDPDGTDDYQAALEEYTAAVNARETALLAILEDKGLGAVNVMCADQQLGFVRWTGLNVVEVFGRPETFTPQILQDLVDKGRAGDVTLILDNMQSGADAGAGLAEELGAARVILSNFPGGYDDTDTWEETINLNVDMILEALGK